MRCSSSAPASQCVSFVHTVHVWACVYLYVCMCVQYMSVCYSHPCKFQWYEAKPHIRLTVEWRWKLHVVQYILSVIQAGPESWKKEKETRVQNQFFISIYNYSRWTLIAKYISLLLDHPMHPVLTEDGSPKSTYLSCWSSDKTPVPFGVLCQKPSDGW